MNRLENVLEILRNCAEHLLPYTFPQNSPLYEDFIYPLKLSQLDVDGYSVEIHFSKADYGEHYLEAVQISGINSPFLPFHIVSKIARIALGPHYLSLIRTPKNGKVYYCWTCCVDRSGKPIPFQHPAKMTKCEFEGFEFMSLSPDSVNFH